MAAAAGQIAPAAVLTTKGAAAAVACPVLEASVRMLQSAARLARMAASLVVRLEERPIPARAAAAAVPADPMARLEAQAVRRFSAAAAVVAAVERLLCLDILRVGPVAPLKVGCSPVALRAWPRLARQALVSRASSRVSAALVVEVAAPVRQWPLRAA